MALVLTLLAATYLAASFFLFRVALPHLPINLRPHFPDLAEVVAQTSKAGTVPRDYIALLGIRMRKGRATDCSTQTATVRSCNTPRTHCIV